jgi:hypothetical protein
MKISDKEKGLLKAGKHKAVIRKENVKEQVGDVAFEIDGVVYRVGEKKHWTLRRCNSDRGTREFGCKTARHFKLMYEAIYGKYIGNSKDLYWLIVLTRDKSQETLEMLYPR